MKPEDEDLIGRFLLGEMAEQERFEFEERFVADEDLFDQINVIEGELIEKYVRGWMKPADRSLFEKNFLTTNTRRERVEFSRALINQAETEAKSAAVLSVKSDTSQKESFLSLIRSLLLTPQTAMAGALGILVAIFGTWLLIRNFSSNQQEVARQNNTEVIATPKPATTPLPEFASNASPNNTEVNSEKNGPLPTPDNSVNVNDKVPGPKKKPVPAKSPEIKRSAPNPVFALFPGLVRSNGKTNELKLPEYSQGATFHLKIDATNYESYQAQITDADGNLIAEFNGLKSSKNGVKFFVKADKLSGGDYLIRLNGVSASGANESVADFQFRVK